MEMSAENLRTGAAELKVACNAVANTMQEIRSTTVELHARLKGVEDRADTNDKKTLELGEKVSGHIGVHIGTEKAGIIAGRRSGMLYGFVSAVVGSFVVILSAWQIFLEFGQ
jgi:uncharacterized membrane protein YeaQ/YmgE (transglycosylase-associated protein family)